MNSACVRRARPARRFDLSIALAVLAILVSGAVVPRGASAGAYFNTTDDGVGIGGYDPVAYFAEGAAVRGRPELRASWGGAEWHFSTSAHRDAFLAQPERYVPRYGGWCSLAMASGRVVEVDFEHAWTVDGGLLYFNYDAEVRLRWLRGINRYVRKADAQWPEARARLEDGDIVVYRKKYLPVH